MAVAQIDDHLPMWRRHREENSKTPRMENKRKVRYSFSKVANILCITALLWLHIRGYFLPFQKILPSFSGMTKPTMVKLGNSFKCSLCKKTGDYPALVPHIQTHARNVMSYRGKSYIMSKPCEERIRLMFYNGCIACYIQ